MLNTARTGSVFFSQPLVIATHACEEMDRDEVAWKREEGDSFIWKDAELPIRSQPLMRGTMPRGEMRASMSTAERQTENGVAADLAQEDADALKHELDEAGSVGTLVEILMGSNVGGKLFTKVMASQHLNFDQKHYVKKTTEDRNGNWDHLFLDKRQVWRPCEVMEDINGSQVRLRFRCAETIKEPQRLVLMPFVASMVDQCFTAVDFEKWKESTAQMQQNSLQRAGETACFGMMPVRVQDGELLQADVFKMRGAVMGQHASMDDFFRTDEAQQVFQKRLDKREPVDLNSRPQVVVPAGVIKVQGMRLLLDAVMAYVKNEEQAFNKPMPKMILIKVGVMFMVSSWKKWSSGRRWRLVTCLLMAGSLD